MSRREALLASMAVACAVVLGVVAAAAESAWTAVAIALGAAGVASRLKIARRSALIVIAVLIAIGGDLLFVTASTGGAGVLPLSGLVACSLALLSSLRLGVRKSVGIVLGRANALLLWTGFGVLLPMLGVLSGLPGRTIATALVPMSILAFVWLGATERAAGTDVGAVMRRALVPLLWLLLGVGLAQFLLGSGTEVPYMGGLLELLDERARSAGREVVYARASGLYANPNTLSFLGGLTAVWAIADRQASWGHRTLMMIPAVGLMAIGQSRMSILSALVSLVVTPQAFLSRGPEKGGRRSGVLLAVACSLLVVLLAVREWAPQVSYSLGERVASMAGGISRGSSLDPSAAGRVGFWALAWSHFLSEPMGTLGPPQMVLGSSIDNEYVYTLVQGGVVYFLLQAWFLIAAFRLARSRRLPVLQVVVAFVIIAGMSQSVTSLAPAAILWLLLGSALSSPTPLQSRSSHV